MGALDLLYRQGKTLYVGISNYSASQTAQAVEILKRLGTPCLIHQPKYSMFERWAENGLLDVLEQEGVGCIPFSPLAQGLRQRRPFMPSKPNPQSPWLQNNLKEVRILR
jgi:L-glyceraldehyde 3-phosphate reductase